MDAGYEWIIGLALMLNGVCLWFVCASPRVRPAPPDQSCTCATCLHVRTPTGKTPCIECLLNCDAVNPFPEWEPKEGEESNEKIT